MTDHTPDRRCLGCRTDISERHPVARRCEQCQAEYRKSRYSHTCTYCGETFRTSSPRAQKFCSYRCRARGFRRATTERSCAVCAVSFSSVTADTCSTACWQWRDRNPGSRFSRVCAYCGESLPTAKPFGTLYCGSPCRNKAVGHRRRVRMSEAPAQNFQPIEIFVRDGWVCHLCGRQIDPSIKDGPDAASLDHLIPVSHPEFPGHVPANVAASHWNCNFVKRHRLTSRDWALYRRLSGNLLSPQDSSIS